MKKTHLWLGVGAVALLAIMLTTCSGSKGSNETAAVPGAYPQQAQVAPQQYAQPAAAAPVIVNNVPAQQSSGVSDMLVGGMAGYMIGNALNSGNRHQAAPIERHTRTIVREKVIVQQTPRAVTPAAQPTPTSKIPSYGSVYSAPRPAATRSTPSYGSTYSSRSSSSFSSPSRSSSSSFSSGRR